MSENEMENRGSKSEIQHPLPNKFSVKEQRVDGSCFDFISKLRYTLMGCESSYLIKIPSKQLNSRNSKYNYSTLISSLAKHRVASATQKIVEINPWFVTGLTDAKGNFIINTQFNKKLKTKWRIKPIFSITLYKKEILLLKTIHNYFNVGKISLIKNTVIYTVETMKDMAVIINHFDNYPLITQKLSDYLIFKSCFDLIKQKKHLTEKGLLEIMSLKDNLNLGLAEHIKNVFPNIKIIKIPKYEFKGIPDPFWVSGFTSGYGSFNIEFRKTGQVFLRFSLQLHSRDLEVFKGIDTYFKQNIIYEEKENKTKMSRFVTAAIAGYVKLQITKNLEIKNIIIPFFDKYPLIGMKILDFEEFKKVHIIIENKEYLTNPSLLFKLKQIKSGMNLLRSK